MFICVFRVCLFFVLFFVWLFFLVVYKVTFVCLFCTTCLSVGFVALEIISLSWMIMFVSLFTLCLPDGHFGWNCLSFVYFVFV